jgi:hypothetical protein
LASKRYSSKSIAVSSQLFQGDRLQIDGEAGGLGWYSKPLKVRE